MVYDMTQFVNFRFQLIQGGIAPQTPFFAKGGPKYWFSDPTSIPFLKEDEIVFPTVYDMTLFANFDFQVFWHSVLKWGVQPDPPKTPKGGRENYPPKIFQ